MTEWCAVVHSTADAMGVLPVSINKFRYLQTKWRTPKAGVVPIDVLGKSSCTEFYWYGSIRGAKRRQADRREAHPVGRANLFKVLTGGHGLQIIPET